MVKGVIYPNNSITPGSTGPVSDSTKPTQGQSQIEGKDFKETLNEFMSDVNELQKDAGKSVEKLLTGEIKDVHDVMVAVEKANTSFELMMEIRNKMLDAYREIMRMQV